MSVGQRLRNFAMHLRSLLVVVVAACAAHFASAGDIYRWIDDQGRTHFSDVVPDRYRSKATRIDSKQFELSAAERAEVEARQAKERARQSAAKERAVVVGAPASVPAAASAPVVPRQFASECEKSWHDYRVSQECYAPFQRRQGGTRVEAYDICKAPVPNPSQRCGPPNW